MSVFDDLSPILTLHKFCASTDLQSSFPYGNCLRKRKMVDANTYHKSSKLQPRSTVEYGFWNTTETKL